MLFRLLIAACYSGLCYSQSCNLGIDSQHLVRRFAFDGADPWADSSPSNVAGVPVNLEGTSIRPSAECPSGTGKCLKIDNDVSASAFEQGTAQYLKIEGLNSGTFAAGASISLWAKFDEVPPDSSASYTWPDTAKLSQLLAFQNSVGIYYSNWFALSSYKECLDTETLCQPFTMKFINQGTINPITGTTNPLWTAFQKGLSDPIPGQWSHLVVNISPTGAYSFYMNGVEAMTGTWGWSLDMMLGPNFGDFFGVVGANTPAMRTSYQDFKGYVDDVRMYNRALTVQEITALYSCDQTNDDFGGDELSNDGGCSSTDAGQCSEFATCSKTDNIVQCTCPSGFADANGDGSVCNDIDECTLEAESSVCHELATCNNVLGGFRCTCMQGVLGNGTHCQTESFSLRSVFDYPANTQLDIDELKLAYTMTLLPNSEVTSTSDVITSMDFAVEQEGGTQQATFNLLFLTEAEASNALNNGNLDFSGMGGTMIDGPDIYRFVTGTTSDPYEVRATGLSVESVSFNPGCMSSGCWVIEVVYTIGSDDFNVFYLPKAEGDDSLSYDFDYTTSAPDASYPGSPASTFNPSTHPCTSMDYDGSKDLPAAITACCIPAFLAMYRPVSTFETALGAITDLDLSVCTSGAGLHQRDRTIDSSTVPVFASESQVPNAANNIFSPPVAPGVMGAKGVFVDGTFSDMAQSKIYPAGTVDPFVGIYKAVIELDEVELRKQAGQLKGTVGVEHTVDTFIGLVNFSPTGSKVLDAGAMQVAIHLEKTSFFSVSTHGTNDYTFLQYVNLRLVSILEEDTATADADTVETASDSIFTDGTDSAVYVQVTFTLGSKYRPNENEGLIPLTSVRTGVGTFFSEVDSGMAHSCAQWAKGAAGWTTASAYPSFDSYASFAEQTTFESRLAQPCAPGASMCQGPLVAADLADQFVSFNIPLGIDYLGVDQADANNDLSKNVFVDMVISAVDNTASVLAGTPNNGDAAQQMKTTLTASIPVVEGGVNLFCDGVVAKTDLKDVATATLIIGSASSDDELSRLTIFEDIASSAMSPEDPSPIATDSIEASLMTLVLNGQDAYFANTGSGAYTLELEDVITVHIMDPSAVSGAGATFGLVKALLAAPGQDNNQGDALDTDGYPLNGAFEFTIDREHGRAHLQPTSALTSLCPFNPTRPTFGGSTCVTRRDVRYRGFPARQGGSSTAIEVASSGVATAANKKFMQSILGASDYAATLATNYAKVIYDNYLKGAGAGRYDRAWWINPGYEWTPTQTNGESIFSLSQEIVMFALINLNENYVDGGAAGDAPSFARRRMLLSNVEDDQGTTAMSLSFDVNPLSLMANALGVAEDRVGLFDVELELTKAEACMDIESLSSALVVTFKDYLTTTSSLTDAVEVVSISRDMGNEKCGGRRALKAFSSASASVQILVAFTEGTEATFNPTSFAELPGIESVTPASDMSSIELSEDFGTTAAEKEAQLKELEAAPKKPASSGGNNMVIIAAAAAGVGAILLGGVAFLLYRRSKNAEAQVVSTVAISISDLKVQLGQEDV